MMKIQEFNVIVVENGEMIDGTARRWHFLEIGLLSGRKEQGYGIEGGRESRFVERIGLSAEQSAISSPRSMICSCQARRPSRIQDFRDSPPTELRVETVMRLFARTCVYI